MLCFAPSARVLALAAGLSLLASVPAGAHEKDTKHVDIEFAARAGATPVGCGTAIPGLGSTAQSARLKDLRFYVSEVALVTRSGRKVPVKISAGRPFRAAGVGGAVTLIDLENGSGSCAEDGTKATNAHVRGTVPAGKYVGARWTVGVPFGQNHTDLAAAPAPLNLAAMGWGWQIGRKFVKIEVTDPAGPTGTWAANTFFVHLGSTGCTGNPASGEPVKCAAGNRANVRFSTFDPARQKVAVDLKALVAGNDITVNRADAPGCMSEQTDPECSGVFRALGIGWRADGSGSGLSPSNKQSLFRLIAR